jgi:hypothetical protein
MSERLAAAFRRFATQECPEDPLYVALCLLVAERPALAAGLSAAPPEQRRPNLWLAAVQDRLLELGGSHPLAAYYPSLGGGRAPDPALAATVADFVASEGAALDDSMRTRSTQTNEIGRCAVLYPMLLELARRFPGRPLALLDVGTSAGLNLGVDTYRYDHGGAMAGAPAAPGVPVIACDPVGPLPLPLGGAFTLAHRLGIDPSPVDIHDERDVRWLRACLWPHDRARARRFDDAVALARTHRWPVRREADCTAALEPWVDSLPDGVLPVVFNSWVLAYFGAEALRHHIDTLTDLVAHRGVAWLSAEAPGVGISAPGRPPLMPGSSAWTLVSRHADGVRTECVAWSHPHGRHLEWRAPR